MMRQQPRRVLAVSLIVTTVFGFLMIYAGARSATVLAQPSPDDPIDGTGVVVASPGPQGSPSPSPSCIATTTAGNCGTNINNGSITCGTQTCFFQTTEFGPITNCQGGQTTGRHTCEEDTCDKTVTTFECNEAGNACQVKGEPAVTEIVNTTQAAGTICGVPQ